MATTGKGKAPPVKAAKQAESKATKQARPRAARRKSYQMTVVLIARETALLPEPLRSSAVVVAQAIIRFFQHAWQELAGAGAADPAPRLLPPGDSDAREDE